MFTRPKSQNATVQHVDNKSSSSTATTTSPDMKAMCALMGQLNALKKSAEKKQSPSSKASPKQNTSFKKFRKRLLNKTVKENNTRKNSDIRDWLVSETKKSERVDKKSKTVNHRQKTKVKKVSSPEKDTMMSYYLKYGVKVPSFESMMKHCKETEEYQKTLEENQLQPITEFPEYKTHVRNFKKTKSGKKGERLHCKHLTLEEVREALVKYMSYAAEIQSEEVFCERHAAFCRQQRRANFDQLADLVGSDTSTEAFTDEHIQEMLRMLAREFGDKAQYYLVVLLPELCLRIFMDVHKMSEEEAVKYLGEQSYSDDSDLD